MAELLAVLLLQLTLLANRRRVLDSGDRSNSDHSFVPPKTHRCQLFCSTRLFDSAELSFLPDTTIMLTDPKPFPPHEQPYAFVYWTHNLERIDVKMPEIQSAHQGRAKIPNPYADGHFAALGFAYNHLLDKDYFPAKLSNISDPNKAEAALFWLKDLHKAMLTPVVNRAIATEQEDQNIVLMHHLGKYRTVDVPLSTRMAPHPELIKPILHQWLRDVAGVHDRLGAKARKVYGLKPQEAKELSDTAQMTKMLFSVVQPLSYANNRFGRLLENILRLQWRLPWKDLSKNDYEKFVQQLGEYEIQQLPNIISAAQKKS